MRDNIDIAGHVSYSLRNAAVKKWPFPHFCAHDVFPVDFYRDLLKHIDDRTTFSGVSGKYEGRTFSHTDDIELLDFMRTKDFLKDVVSIFAKEINERYQDRKMTLYTDLRLVRDGKGYQIGPHTDAQWKLISLLFYLPRDGWHGKHGTSIYLPIEPNIRCPGGPHYRFDKFRRIYTAPYYPNTCFGFLKTDNSFHGVEPIEDEMRRDVLLYNVYDETFRDQIINKDKEDA